MGGNRVRRAGPGRIRRFDREEIAVHFHHQRIICSDRTGAECAAFGDFGGMERQPRVKSFPDGIRGENGRVAAAAGNDHIRLQLQSFDDRIGAELRHRIAEFFDVFRIEFRRTSAGEKMARRGLFHEISRQIGIDDRRFQ